MSILSGFKKVRRHIRLPDGYKLLSFWTSSQTVEMDDGTTLESNKTKWDDASNKKHEHSNKDALDSITSNNITKWNDMSTNIDATIALKANQSELETHIKNNTIHITADERTKLSGIATGANKYTHPPSAAGAKTSGLYKIATDANGHVTGATTVTKADITALGIPASDTNTTYGTGTASVSGLTKLYTSTGTSTDGTMTRTAITNALNSKASISHNHTEYNNFYTILKGLLLVKYGSYASSGGYSENIKCNNIGSFSSSYGMDHSSNTSQVSIVRITMDGASQHYSLAIVGCNGTQYILYTLYNYGYISIDSPQCIDIGNNFVMRGPMCNCTVRWQTITQ